MTVELCPFGDTSDTARQVLGVAYIANDGEQTLFDRSTGSYDVKLMKSPVYARSEGVWKKGHVEDFPRKRLGPWDLLYRCLSETVGSRNP